MVQKLIQKNAEITLGYWGIRGLGQPIRLLLAAAGKPFSELRFGVLQDGTLLDRNLESDDWASAKAALYMPFPNLPYLIDTSGPSPVMFSQSNAILRHLARRFDFYGDSEQDRINIDVLQEQAYDFRNEIVDTAYTLGEEYTAAFKHFSNITLPKQLDSFERYLANHSDTKHFVGNRLSLVDFVLYELLWQMTLMVPNSITDTSRPTLFSFINKFETQPNIADYMRSKYYIERPINSPWASFT